MNESLILIVDDVAKNLQLIGTVLRNKGYDIALASSGKEALETLKEKMPDLILLDVMMPGMDGFEVCKIIKSDERLQTIPVIFLTGKSDQKDIVKGFELGAADYITKPFNTTELILRVNTQVELQKSQDELRKKNLELLRINASKDLFFSIISHDLKSPFQGLIGLTELLNEDIYTMEKKEILEFSRMINESSRHLLNLLNNLLEWSILERNKQQYYPATTDLVNIIDNNIRLFSATGASKKVTLTNLSEDAVTALVDENMVNTIVRNLLSNAIKYTQPGGKVELSANKTENGVVLRVSDTGIGMDQKIRDNLFRIESMKSRVGTKNEKGTGLGLLICNELVKKNSGNLEIDSTPGAGTMVTVHLPSN